MYNNWEPQIYLKFSKERLQPSYDLANRIEIESPRKIIDVGCGPGTSTSVLNEKWPSAEIIGIDNSADMISVAQNKNRNIQWILYDITHQQELDKFGPIDIVFANAVLQWIPDHERVIEKLFDILKEGGALAIQVPFEQDESIYKDLLRVSASPKWKSYFNSFPEYPKHYNIQHYLDIAFSLSSHTQIWKTEYMHLLDSYKEIVDWYKGTGMRPVLEKLPDEELRDLFCKDYESNLQQSYKREINGKLILRFPRLFIILYKL